MAHLIEDNYRIGIKIMFDKSYHDAIIKSNKIQELTDAVMRDNVFVAGFMGFIAYSLMIALIIFQAKLNLASTLIVTCIIAVVAACTLIGFIAAALVKRHHFQGYEHLFD